VLANELGLLFSSSQNPWGLLLSLLHGVIAIFTLWPDGEARPEMTAVGVFCVQA